MEKPHLKMNSKFTAICPYVLTISKFICIVESFENSGTFDADHFTTNLT